MGKEVEQLNGVSRVDQFPGPANAVACEHKSYRLRPRPRLKNQNQAGTLGVCQEE